MSLDPTRGSEQPDVTLSECFEADHRRFDLKLIEAELLAATGALPEASDSFDEFASSLNRHIDAEEEILFPAVEALTGQLVPTAVMRAEHAEIRDWLSSAAAALKANDAARFEAAFHALSITLAIHNMEEEYVLYPAADAAVGNHTRDDLVRRMLAR